MQATQIWCVGQKYGAIRPMTESLAGSAVTDTLCDALATGRVCMAEMVLLDPPELEAMFEVAAARLDTGRVDDAIVLLAALVTLYGYSAKYWRALGVALHLAHRQGAAMQAYRLALHLDPDHALTLCYLGELMLFGGSPDDARPLLEQAAHSRHHDAARRAQALLQLPPPAAPAAPAMEEAPAITETTAPWTFALRNGVPLPLAEESTVTGRHLATFPTAKEVTNKIFLADREPSLGSITETAIIRRAGSPAALPAKGSGTDTALVPGVAAARAPRGWDFVDWFASAARRRRMATSLLDEHTAPVPSRSGRER